MPPLQRTPANICTNFMSPGSRVNGLHFCRDSMSLSSFNFLWWAPKDASFMEQNAYRPLRSSKVIDYGTNRKGACDFLLVINSNFGPILHRFWDNWEFFLPHPCLTTPFRGNPSEFLDETYRSKTRGMGLLYGENCMTLTWTVFDWSTRVTDRQTDGRNCGSIYRAQHSVAR